MSGDILGLSADFENGFLHLLKLEEIRPFALEAVRRATAQAPVPVTLSPGALEQVIDGGGINDATGIFNYVAQTMAPSLINGWIAANKPEREGQVLEITAVKPHFAAQWKNPAPG